MSEGEAGDNVGLLLRGIDKSEVKRGMVVVHPGAITPHDHFKASIYVLKKKKVVVIILSVTNIVHSSIFVQWTVQVK